MLPIMTHHLPLATTPIRFSSRTAIFPLAWRLAAEFKLPSTYDVTIWRWLALSAVNFGRPIGSSSKR
jgi:hypothetical protein